MIKIEQFIQMVTNGDFIDAHEILEHDWKELKKAGQKDNAKFIQALINGTTAIALFQKGKIDGSQRVWSTFIKYKHLIDKIDLPNKERYQYAIDILEKRYQEVVC